MAIALDQEYADVKADTIEQRLGLPFSFTGRAGEYFGIWIVNILLSIITLGIYSAWAKVRNKRYFYGNTKLNGSSFDYLASPIQILKGRIIMFVIFAAFALCQNFYPIAVIPFIIVLYLITPWVMIKALAFNARNSSYRNVRFNFTGKLWEAAKVYVLIPLGTLITLGGLIPFSAFRMNEFVANHSHYGKSSFRFGGTAREYYKAYGIALLIALPFIVIYGAFMVFGAYISIKTFGMDPEAVDTEIEQMISSWMASYGHYLDLVPVHWLPVMAPLAILLAVIGYTYLTARLQNYFFSNTKVAEHRFHLDLSFWRLLWIRLSNLVVIALTIGLMVPWAKIRMARYQIERMSLIPRGDLDTLVSEQQGKTSAYGEELGEGMDLDLGLGV